MEMTFDPGKRDATLGERRLNFRDAKAVFAGAVFERVDDRFDYGETPQITVGRLRERTVVVVWTLRGANRHVISMRKAIDREQARYEARLGGP